MTFKYKKEFLISTLAVVLCFSVFLIIKSCYFKNVEIHEPLKNVISYYNKDKKNPNILTATTKVVPTTMNITSVKTLTITSQEEELEEKGEFPYSIAPTYEDDGSIIYDGLNLTQLTDKLNRSLGDYMSNTGYFFAEFTKDTGMDPYLSVAIVLLETGCKWKCSTLTVKCNNIGGLKGSGSCNGGSYSEYDTLEQGIDSYLNIIYKNYYLKGLTTPESMGRKYAASSEWANKVNAYIEEIKAK